MPRSPLPLKEFKWTPELAYVVGLLATDGCLSKDGRHIIMRSSDKDLLETFLTCLHSTNRIEVTINNGYSNKPCYRVQLGNVQLYKWLLKIGLFPAKTYTLGEIKISNNVFADFLRGHLDGDGTIRLYKDSYNSYRGRVYTNKRVCSFFLSASHTHIKWLYKRISNLLKIFGAIIEIKPWRENRVTLWNIKYSKHASLSLLKALYYKPGLPCLRRKERIASMILEIIPKETRRPYARII